MAIRAELSCGAYYAGKFAEAERESRQALTVDPESPLLYWSLARALAQQGKLDSGPCNIDDCPDQTWVATGPVSLLRTAYLYGRQNRRADALRVIAQLREREKTEYVDAYLYAMAYAGLSDTAEVCRYLEDAAQNDSTWIPSVAVDPKFARAKG